MPIIGALPFTLQNGQVADATQVMADFNAIVTGTNSGAAPLANTALLNAANVFTQPQTVPNGTTRVHAPNIGQVQDSGFMWCGTFAGTANALTANLAPAITAYVAGQTFRGVVNAANTAAVTVALNGIAGPKALTKNGTDVLVANDLRAGDVVEVVYDGTQFQLMTVYPFGNSAAITAAATTDLTTRNGNYVTISGNTGITAFTLLEGDIVFLVFTGTPAITAGASLICPNGSMTIAAGDTMVLAGEAAGVVRVLDYQPVGGFGTLHVAAKGDLPVGTGAGTSGILTVGANDKVLAADSTQTTGLIYSTLGRMVWLSTQTASNSATLDFTSLITSRFDVYEFVISALIAQTDTTNLYMRVSEDNGGTWKAGGGDYAFNAFAFLNSTSVSTAGATSAMLLNGSAIGVNASVKDINGQVRLYHPLGTNSTKSVNSHINYIAPGGEYAGSMSSGRYIGTTNAINAVRFLQSSGNLVSGTITLYGILPS